MPEPSPPEAGSSPTPEEQAAELDGLVLLGSGRARAAELLAALAGLREPAPEVDGVRAARAAEVAYQGQHPDAAQLLEAAAAAWTPPRQTSLRLRAVRAWAQAQEPDTAAIRFDELLDDGLLDDGQPVPPGEVALTRAALGGDHVRSELEAALAALPSPAADADRLDAHLRLADLLQTGGDTVRAQQQLEAALGLARRHEDLLFIGLSSALLGNVLVERGRLDAARPHLEAALAVAWERGDGLMVLSVGTVLVALQQRGGDWQAVAVTARALGAVARERGHWLALADAAVAEGVGLREQGRLREAVEVLVAAYDALAEVGADVAQRILQAHLAEVRAQVGKRDFDALVEEVAGPRTLHGEEE